MTTTTTSTTTIIILIIINTKKLKRTMSISRKIAYYVTHIILHYDKINSISNFYEIAYFTI
jgi:hypothetical protein